MSKNAHLVYPHQLYAQEYLPEGIETVFVVEDPLYFGSDQKFPVYFHKQKLILHRASMQRYIEEVLWPAKYEVVYVEFDQLQESGDIVQKLRGYEHVTVFDPTDDILQRRLQAAAAQVPDAPQLTMLDSPNFYLKRQEVALYFGKHKQNSFGEFYQWQRERFNVLIDESYKPVGGKWSFDDQSRQRLPKGQSIPTFEVYGSNKYVEEARLYIRKNFPNNPGDDETFSWPTNHEEAEQWLHAFILHRLEQYGPYQDAIDGQAPWLHHSAISPCLNIGLLQPQAVIGAVLGYHQKHPVPLPSLEGFVRQILGWREFVRGLYLTRQVKMRTANGFEHQRLLAQDWYQATTGIPPLDDVIKKILARGYIHHVERLMVVGNMMLISEINPKEVYQWNMELSIDAYDWVTVPNVYGLSQYADGNSMTNKPNISDSNYILQMSYYDKGDWADVWDGLYWDFIEKHRDIFAKNPHMKLIVSQLRQIDPNRRRIIGYRAADFLNGKTKLPEGSTAPESNTEPAGAPAQT